MKRSIFILALISIFSISLSAQNNEISQEAKSQIHEVILDATDHLGCKDTLLVILPKDYNQQEKYTTIYCLHGLGGKPIYEVKNFHLWDIATQYNEIIICPDGHKDSWYLDSPIEGEMQYQTYFFEQLMPYLNEHYAIDQNNTFITGISMGGHGAMTLFMAHPEKFRGVGSSSGVLDLKYSGSRDKTVAAVIGQYDNGENENFRKYSANYNIEKLIPYKDKFIYIDCGTEDYLFDAALTFLQECRKNHIPVKAQFSPGRHHQPYWHNNFYRHFSLFQAQAQLQQNQ